MFADVDASTLNLDPDAVAAAITPATRAILPVHFAGGPCDMDALQALAAKHDLRIIEDAAHAVEASVGDRKVGSIGDFTCFSLYATKSLAGGEGGLITTASDEAAARLRLLRSQGISRDPWRRRQNQALGYYDVEEPGFKANLGDLHAAAALPGLEHIEAAARPAGGDRRSATTRRWPGLTDSSPSAGRRSAGMPTTSTWCGSTPAGRAPTATGTPRR